MRIKSYLPRRSRHSMLILLAVACLAALSFSLRPAVVEAGTIEIPAWAFVKGNVKVDADPSKFADAGPVVVGTEPLPWGWSVTYAVDIPVEGRYTLQVGYASAESRPVKVLFDGRELWKCCNGVSVTPPSAEKPNLPTWKSSGVHWELLRNRFGGPAALAPVKNGTATAGKHTITIQRRGPLPHLVGLRLETPEPFPEDWQPPKHKVLDIKSIPVEFRSALTSPKPVDVAALRKPAAGPPKENPGTIVEIPAWTFDRGNANIHASPDKYADAGPVVGGPEEEGAEGFVEYDIDFPADGDYTLQLSYASDKARPVEVFIDDKSMGVCCLGVTYDTAPGEDPVVFTSNSSGVPKVWETFRSQGKMVKMPVTKGKHTLKFARDGRLPNLLGFRLGSPSSFPEGYLCKMPNFDKVPVKQRSVFLPHDAVNIEGLRLSIEDAIETYGAEYPDGEKYLKRLKEFAKLKRSIYFTPTSREPEVTRVWASEAQKPEPERTIEKQLTALRREAMAANPALNFEKLLFVKQRHARGHIYEAHLHKAGEGNSLCVLSPVSPDGKITDIAPQLAGGRFSRFDLSPDGKKVIFGYRTLEKSFRIYEMGIDGKGLRQLTFVDDEVNEGLEACKDYGRSAASIQDTDPIYLPNGDIMFVSTRSMQCVFCFPATVTNLYLMDADGKNMRRLSYSPLTEMGPSLLDDGRVAYTRWEYVDKGLGNGQSLWVTRPDGSGVDHLYKNSVMRPSGMLHPRSIPGSTQFVTVGNSHMSRSGGPVIMVDTRITKRSPEAMTCLTPEVGYPCMYTAKWGAGFFLDPWPFSEKYYLVSHKPGGRPKDGEKPHTYGIYMLDRWGNRAELFSDPELSCYQPTPLLPRKMPANIAQVKTTNALDPQKENGVMFIQDIYQGMTGIERGRVKYVRVMGVLPWPWSENGMFRLGLAGNVHRKKVYGVAEVHEDGSACFEVPAGENILFQALDENYMMVQHMPTFINMNPGEKRGCVGCHEHRSKAPDLVGDRPMAMANPVRKLMPQPGDTGPRMVHYAADIQPILDKNCVSCHGATNPKARLNLTGEPTETWNRSYESIFDRGLVSSRNCGFGRSGFRPAGPLSFGSHRSKLIEQIRSDPCKGNLTKAEFIKIVTWIDANTPYYGTYRGIRELKDKDSPNFRLPPLVTK